MNTGTRKRDEPDLVPAAEAAEVLGVDQTNLRRVAGWDKIVPYQRFRSGPVYRKSDIKKLARSRKNRALSKVEEDAPLV